MKITTTPEIKNTIKDNLIQIEEEYNVEVVFAVENGSQVWGMESINSDFDVRFVYKRKIIDYLKLFSSKKDTIEKIFPPITNYHGLEVELDIIGWDLKKFLHLYAKSNPTAIEWLQSPILYKGTREYFDNFQLYFSPLALYHHYRSLSYTQFDRYIENKLEVNLKKYLYVLRGAINALHINKNQTLPDIQLITTANNLPDDLLPEKVINQLIKIIKSKKEGIEMNKMKRIRVIDEFVKSFFSKYDAHTNMLKGTAKKLPKEQLELVYSTILGIERLKTIKKF